MVTTPSSSAASLRIWLASTCASSRMEKSASATAPRIQHATRQSSQRGGRGAPGQPGQRGQRRTRAAGLTVSSSLGSRAMPPPATPRRPAPGAGRGRRSPPNFPVSCAPGSAARRRWLANLGGARLQRGRAGGHHRPAAAAPRPRRPQAGAAESTGGAALLSLPRVPAQPGDGGSVTSASAAARLGRSPGEEGEGGLKDPSERRERKESGEGKGGVWCHHAALWLRTLPGSAAAAAAVIYGKRREAGKVPRSPLLSLACTGRRPGTLGIRDVGDLASTGPSWPGKDTTGTFWWLASRPFPALPALAHSGGSRDPRVTGSTHPPPKVPFKFENSGVLPDRDLGRRQLPLEPQLPCLDVISNNSSPSWAQRTWFVSSNCGPSTGL